MNRIIKQIHETIQNAATLSQEKAKVFFKTGRGEYGEHDRFLGVTVPNIRQIAKSHYDLEMDEIEELLLSPFNEERFLALVILIEQFNSGSDRTKGEIFHFYLDHLDRINNWNLVDCSAHWIVGAYLFNKSKKLLDELAQRNNLWHRRVAIVSTWYFIRNDELEPTYLIAKKLLHDHEDLIHKATGWMLREAGKKNEASLTAFLDQCANSMPRTMLRYAIERFDSTKRANFL